MAGEQEGGARMGRNPRGRMPACGHLASPSLRFLVGDTSGSDGLDHCEFLFSTSVFP